MTSSMHALVTFPGIGITRTSAGGALTDVGESRIINQINRSGIVEWYILFSKHLIQ